jgi:PAS domain S-box-containing protein
VNDKDKKQLNINKQKAIKNPELLYRTVFNQSPDGILIFDIQGNFIEFNEAAHRHLGYSREEFAKLHISDFDQPPAGEIQGIQKTVIEKGSAVFNVKQRTKNGEFRDVHVIAQSIVLGGRTFFHTIWRDITEKSKGEEALLASAHFLKIIIETVPECVKLLDSHGGLLMMNRAGLAMIEADSFDQVKGESIYRLIPPEYTGAVKKHVEAVFQGEDGTLELDMIGLKGRRLRLKTRSVPLRNEKNEITALLGITRDITEQKKMEEEKEKLLSKLQDALTKVKLLSGFLPICVSCKKIRDDKGYWNQIESYIRDHSEADFTHGLCPDCANKIYPDFFGE